MPGLAPYIRTLAADGRTTIEVRGTTIFVRRTTEELRVSARSNQVGAADGTEYTVRMGASEKWFTADEFDSVTFENTGSSETEIEVLIGSGDFFRPVPDIINVAVTSLASASVETTPDVINAGIGNANKVTILAANPARISAILTALDTNDVIARIGGSDVDINEGTQLQAGESLLWPSKAACEACIEAAGVGTIAVLEHIE